MNLLSIFFCFLFISELTFGKDIVIKPIEIAEDAENFFPSYGSLIYIPNFYTSPVDAKKYATKTSKRIIKLPASVVIDRFDFEKGDLISVADFDRLKTFQYKIKDHIYVLLFEVPSDSPISNSSLILSDDPKVHEELANKLLKREHVTGLAYRGTQRKVKSSLSIDWIPVKEIPKSDPIYKMDDFKIIKPEVIKKANLYQYEVIVHPVEKGLNISRNRHVFFFKKPDGTYEGFPRDSHLLDNNNDQKMMVYDWLEGTKIFRMFDDDGGRTTPSELFILCSPKSLSLLNVGGGFDVRSELD